MAAIERWQGRADDLRSEATDLGDALAEVEAGIARAGTELELLATQVLAAEERMVELTGEAISETARMDAFAEVSRSLAECAEGRLRIVRRMWQVGIGSLDELEASTTPLCDTAEADYDALMAEEG